MPLEGARDASRFFLSRVAAQVDGLSLKRYPGDHPGPMLWFDVIRGVVDTALDYLKKSEDPAKSATESAELVRDAGRFGMLAYDCLNMVAGAGTDDMPYPVVIPMNRWFRRVGLDYSTLFRAELVANYEIRPFDRSLFSRIRNRSPSLDRALANIEWPLYRITVPSKALGMLPHFAIVAHEIGHAIFPKVAWNFSAHAAAEAALLQRIQTRLGASPFGPSIVVFVTQVFQRWLQEIASDAFGLLMAGPAFFFALCGFLQAAGAGMGISESHPANALRRDLLFDKLSAPAGASFAETFQARLGVPLSRDLNSELMAPLPPIPQLIADLTHQLVPTPQITSAQKAIVLAELTPYMQAIADQVYIQAEQHLRGIDPAIIYTPQKFDNDITEHLEALISAVPPIETGGPLESRKAADFATILNIGWIVLLTKLSQLAVRPDTNGDVTTSRAEKLHSLLLKGVELSEARRLWESTP